MAEITIKGQPGRTVGELPAVGASVPDFRLADRDFNDRTLADFQGPLLLNIVLSLDTSVCAASAQRFNEMAKRFPGVTMATVSADLPFAQKRVCGDSGLDNMTTLSTMRGEGFGRDYGVRIADGPLEGLCSRAVVVIGGDRRVLYTQLVSETSQEPDYDAVEQALAS